MILSMTGWSAMLVQLIVIVIWGIPEDTVIEMFQYIAGGLNHVVRVLALVQIFQGLIGLSALNGYMERCRKMLALKMQIIVMLACGSAVFLLPFTREYLEPYTVTMLILMVIWAGVVLLWLVVDCILNYLFMKGLVRILADLGEEKEQRSRILRCAGFIFAIDFAVIVSVVAGVGIGPETAWMRWAGTVVGTVLTVCRLGWQGYCVRMCRCAVRIVEKMSI